MSSKVEVLCPNGHRVSVKITPNTKFLQILEEACDKKGFHPSADYELKHGRKTLDLTLTFRYAGLANNAKLELVKAAQSRLEGGNVTVALQLEGGTRLQGEFASSVSLWDLLLHWDHKPERSQEEKLAIIKDTLHPVCVYMREEIMGEFALKETTLKQLGLIGGRAIFRLIHREIDPKTLEEIKEKILQEKQRQDKLKSSAAIGGSPTSPKEVEMPSADPKPATSAQAKEEPMDTDNISRQQPIDRLPQQSVSDMADMPCMRIFPADVSVPRLQPQVIAPELPQRMSAPRVPRNAQPQPSFADFKFPEATKGMDLYRNEFSEANKDDFKPCDREVVVYNLRKEGPSVTTDSEDLPPDFFEVTEKDVRMMWEDQQRKMMEEADQPLMTQSMKKALQEMKLAKYSRVILKIHFPEKVVLQAVFRPRETVYAVEKFLKEVLEDSDIPFYLYTSPPKCILKDKAQTLLDANLVPMSVVYFGSECSKNFYLSRSILGNMATEREAAAVILKNMPVKNTSRSDYGSSGSARPKTQPHKNNPPASNSAASSASGSSGNVPKWFKPAK